MIYLLLAVHNRAELTRKFFEGISQQTYLKDNSIQVVLVDDGSTDNTVEVTKEFFPDAVIIPSNGNWWWSFSMFKGCEYILEHATTEDYVVMANNDQLADPDAIELLIATSQKYGDATVGTVARYLDNPDKIYNTAQTINWYNYSYTPIPFDPTEDEYAGEIDVLTCRLTAVPVKALQEVQFDPKFTQYYGDYDLFYNLKKRGYRLIVSNAAKIYDLGGPSGIKTTTNPSLEAIYKQLFSINSHSNAKHTLYYIWKNCPRRLWVFVLMGAFCGVHTVRAIKALFTLNFKA